MLKYNFGRGYMEAGRDGPRDCALAVLFILHRGFGSIVSRQNLIISEHHGRLLWRA